MRSTLQLCTCAAALVLLTSCVESENPLSKLSDSKQDSRLLGLWFRVQDNGDLEYVHVGGEETEPFDTAAQTPEPGLMRYTTVTHSAKTRALKPAQSARFFCTQIAGADYASWISGPDPAKNKPVTYFLLKYQVEPKRLTVWLQDPETTAQAIEAGKLKGVVKRKKKTAGNERGELEELRLTDTTENIAAFFAAGGAATCFPDGNKSVYQRLP